MTPAPHKWRGLATQAACFIHHRVAVRVDTGGESEVYYLHTDHLGSTTLTTDPSGAVTARQLYEPYGAVRWSTGTLPTDYTYTGQRADTTGLMYYHARYYHPALARFVSADTVVPEPGNPQDLNRYYYVRNSPLRYRDPSGHRQCEGLECERSEMPSSWLSDPSPPSEEGEWRWTGIRGEYTW